VRAAPYPNRLVTFDLIQVEDIDIPVIKEDWPGWKEGHFVEESVDLYCAYCPHCKHDTKFVVGDEGSQYYAVFLACANKNHVCPDEAEYNQKIAEFSPGEIRLEQELDEMEAVVREENGIGQWS
tara:strand:- start:74 stop:445 length:372 start_codon:yes stop_codon:yes gene_type:complete